ncbi:hypothetical protein, partial [Rhizobium rhizogenes]|uniref:hypothetical protein n=1 Tax=Rhizobium rhizogenes TaxID=359 RepID=UPI001AEE60CF
NLFVRETCALHSLVLSIGQSLLQNGLFQRGKVRIIFAAIACTTRSALPATSNATTILFASSVRPSASADSIGEA